LGNKQVGFDLTASAGFGSVFYEKGLCTISQEMRD